MIPEWLPNGDLPPGIHSASWRELEQRFGFNLRQRRLLDGFRRACEELRGAGCRLVYLDGSFVTTKEYPGDFDACWDIQYVDDTVLDPVFWISQKGGPPRSAGSWANSFRPVAGRSDGTRVRRVLPTDKLTGAPKGILAVRLRRGRRA